MEMTAMETLPSHDFLESRTLAFKRAKRLRGMPALTGDHGVAYQALALASLAEGSTRIDNLPDTPAMREALDGFAALGLLRSEMLDGQVIVHGGSLGSEPAVPEGGITVRDENLALILGGLIRGREIPARLVLDGHSIGADVAGILATSEPGNPQAAKLEKARLTGFRPRTLQWDDAQAKIFLIHQALADKKPLHLELKRPGCDALETLIAHFHGPLQIDKGEPPEGDELARRIARQMKASGNHDDSVHYKVAGDAELKPNALTLPRDIHQASLWALLAVLIKGSDLVLENVLLNPSRAGFFSALRRMGADLEIVTRREKHGFAYGQVRVRGSELIAKRFDAEALSGMRDEAFLLTVAAAFAEGETIIRDATFMRGYRVDLLKSFLGALKAAGVEAGEFEDGVVVRGRPDYDGAAYDAEGHPGLAAACVAMALKSHGQSTVAGAEGLLWQNPDFLHQLESLQADGKEQE